jgi:RNA polymerase sigma-70 factor (ECF subfamily)
MNPFDRPDELIKRVYAYVAYRIGPGPEAEDVTSTTIERAYRYRSSYDSSRGEPLTWLLGIASRCIRDAAAERYGANGDRQVIPSGDYVEPFTADDIADRTVDRIVVRRAVASLTERERDLIALRYGADLTASQIARHLGAKTNAVEVALHRALGRLRAELEAAERPPAEAPLDAPLVEPAPRSV